MTENSIEESPKGERIAKALARAGIGSRRDIERMIEDGRITVQGKKLESPAFLVTSLEGIMVDGEAVMIASEAKLWRYHKPRGVLTTHKDPEGRPTVFEKLPEHMGRVISVGRLDMTTEGLLLLTNDGELARWLELPQNEVIRRYRVRVYGRVNETALRRLKDGATIDGIHYGAIDAEMERQQGANTWLTVAIKEGKNREVRRVMEHLGLTVNRLIRTHYGPFSLGTIEMGTVAQVGDKQLHEVLPGYFTDMPTSVAAPVAKRDPSKWAKAKPKPVKPGVGRRREGGGKQSAAGTRGASRHSIGKQEASPSRDTDQRSSDRATQNRSGSERPDSSRPNSGRPDTRRPETGRSDTNRPAAQKNFSGKPTGNARPSGGSRPSGSTRPTDGQAPNRRSGPHKQS